jgi:hypothetical protein
MQTRLAPLGPTVLQPRGGSRKAGQMPYLALGVHKHEKLRVFCLEWIGHDLSDSNISDYRERSRTASKRRCEYSKVLTKSAFCEATARRSRRLSALTPFRAAFSNARSKGGRLVQRSMCAASRRSLEILSCASGCAGPSSLQGRRPQSDRHRQTRWMGSKKCLPVSSHS